MKEILIYLIKALIDEIVPMIMKAVIKKNNWHFLSTKVVNILKRTPYFIKYFINICAKVGNDLLLLFYIIDWMRVYNSALVVLDLFNLFNKK